MARSLLVQVTWEELEAVRRLAGDVWGPPPPEGWPDDREQAWEAGLREILGHECVDAMKRLALAEPTEFKLEAVRQETQTAPLMLRR